MSKYDDPRIAKLPHWVQSLIAEGEHAERSAAYWHERADEAGAKIQDLIVEHARTGGAEQYDTWIVKGDDSDGAEIRYGLGVGQAVDFGDPSELCGTYTVTYRNGGLDIRTMMSDLSVKFAKYGDETLRVE